LLRQFNEIVDNAAKPTEQYQTQDGIIAFVRDILRVKKLAPYQETILRTIVTDYRVAVRGPHGLGKTALAAWVVLWVITCFDGDVKAPTTASSWRQLTKFLWPEIHKWARRANWEKLGIRIRSNKELLGLSLRLDDKEAFALASNNPETMEGAHGDVLFYVFDEAKAIPAGTWDAIEGAFSTAGKDTANKAFALAISTPGNAIGRFYDIHKRKAGYEDWTVIHVTLEEAIAAGRISREWAEKRAKQWGVDSGVYKMRVLGEFDTSGLTTLIPLEWIEAANERWACSMCGKAEGQRVLACDPAWLGTDKTAIAEKIGNVITGIHYSTQERTMATVGRLVTLSGKDQTVPIGVDSIGIGTGVVDRLKEMKYNVLGVNVSQSTKDTDRSGLLGFKNLRAQLWWMVRELLDPAYNPTLALPPDPTLTGDLMTPTYGYTSTGLIYVESKENIRKRIGRSTDAADAVMIAIYTGLRYGRQYRSDLF
jgi:hypothetical protein